MFEIINTFYSTSFQSFILGFPLGFFLRIQDFFNMEIECMTFVPETIDGVLYLQE